MKSSLIARNRRRRKNQDFMTFPTYINFLSAPIYHFPFMKLLAQVFRFARRKVAANHSRNITLCSMRLRIKRRSISTIYYSANHSNCIKYSTSWIKKFELLTPRMFRENWRRNKTQSWWVKGAPLPHLPLCRLVDSNRIWLFVWEVNWKLKYKRMALINVRGTNIARDYLNAFIAVLTMLSWSTSTSWTI